MDPQPVGQRSKETEAEFGVLQHVAMAGELDLFPPVTGIDQFFMRCPAVHPFVALRIVMIGEGKMRRRIAGRLANGDALQIQRIGHPADRRLGALVVDVPGVEMLKRPGVHQDERRVDDRPGVHQRPVKRVFERLDGRIGAGQDLEGVGRACRREDAGGQPRRPHRNGHLRRSMLARQVRQGAGLGKGDAGRIAALRQRLGKDIAAKGAGRQKHHLAVLQNRGQDRRQCVLRRRRQRDDDQLGARHRLAEIGGREAQRHLAFTVGVDQHQLAGFQHRREGRRIAPPQA